MSRCAVPPKEKLKATGSRTGGMPSRVMVKTPGPPVPEVSAVAFVAAAMNIAVSLETSYGMQDLIPPFAAHKFPTPSTARPVTVPVKSMLLPTS